MSGRAPTIRGCNICLRQSGDGRRTPSTPPRNALQSICCALRPGAHRSAGPRSILAGQPAAGSGAGARLSSARPSRQQRGLPQAVRPVAGRRGLAGKPAILAGLGSVRHFGRQNSVGPVPLPDRPRPERHVLGVAVAGRPLTSRRVAGGCRGQRARRRGRAVQDARGPARPPRAGPGARCPAALAGADDRRRPRSSTPTGARSIRRSDADPRSRSVGTGPRRARADVGARSSRASRQAGG